MEFEERPISSKTVFHGHLIDVEVQQVITPHGNKTQREIVHHAPAIAILALTADNKMILEKQWRAPIAKTTLEIPAGKLDQRDADNALHAAKRELNEETRYEATSLKKISSFYTSVGCMDEYMTTCMKEQHSLRNKARKRLLLWRKDLNGRVETE